MIVVMLLLPFFVLSVFQTHAAVSLDFIHTDIPHTTRVKNGQTVTFDCEARGSPAAAVYWLKDGKPIAETMSNQVSNYTTVILAMTVGRLLLNCVNKESEAVYTCIAEHLGERITFSTNLVVEDDPIYVSTSDFEDDIDIVVGIRSKACYPSEPTYISMWMKNTLANDGSDVVLYCRGTGVPYPLMEWFDPYGYKIRSYRNGKYRIKPNGDLQIRDITWTDMGNYICRASNQLAAQNVSSFLYPVIMGLG